MRNTTLFGVSLAALAALVPIVQQGAGAPAAPQPAGGSPVTGTVKEAEPEAVEPYRGTLADGMREIEALNAKKEYGKACGVGDALLAPTDFLRWRQRLEANDSKVIAPFLDWIDPLLAWLGLDGYSEPVRAEVHYAQGLVHRAAEEPKDALAAFEKARALAGPGELRLASMYNGGVTVLEEAEALRAQIPEISGQAPAPAQPPAAAVPPGPGAAPAPFGPGASGGAQPPDPLQLAREAYLEAKEHLVERLRADWRDPDTRANVELVQRRLKELDEIEKKREEEKQKQEDQQKQQDPQQDKDQQKPQDEQGDEKKPDDQKDDQEKQDEQKPDEKKPEDEKKDEQKDDAQQDQPEPDEQKPDEKDAKEVQEVYLTREEVQRLLDKLREHEEEGQVVQERLHQNARKGTRRDW